MTLEQYCKQLGWNTAMLAREAGINYETARRARAGDAISSRTARDIAKALSTALGKAIRVGEIQGLNY